MTTMCEDCEHLEAGSAKLPPYRWLCTKHPNLLDAPLSRTQRTNEPFLLCKNVNGGMCFLFNQKKETKNA